MHTLYMKEKAFSLRGRFSIQDEAGHEAYHIEGSFMKLPKSFSVTNRDGEEVAEITKKTFSFRPVFYVEAAGQSFEIIKEFTFFKDRYTINSDQFEVTGDWWDVDFEVLQQGKRIGRVQKKWISWTDQYIIEVEDEAMEELLIALVVAIDCVKAEESSNSTSFID